MHKLGIQVVGGLHDGAVLAFVEGEPRQLGSGGAVGILLIDEQVAEHQCTILWNGRDLLALDVVAAGMRAYGRHLDAGKHLDLPVGAAVCIGVVKLVVVNLEDASPIDAAPIVSSASAAEMSTAARRVLKQLHWSLYAKELLRRNTLPYWIIGGAAATAAAAVGVFTAFGGAVGLEELREEVAARVSKAFPAVKVSAGTGAGTILYEGHVRDQRELNELRSTALGVDVAGAVMKVVPMDVMRFHASMWLEKYYQDAVVDSAAPGELKVTVASELAVRVLEGWDFGGVARELMRELPELSAVHIAFADGAGKEIAVPASEVGMSFVPTEDGPVYVVAANGAALFPGAATSEGRIESISDCSMLLHSRSAGTKFRLLSGTGACANKDVPPVRTER